MWKTLVVLFRMPLTVAWAFLRAFVYMPLVVALSLVVFIWAMVTVPFMVGAAVVRKDPKGARAYIREVAGAPLGLLGTLKYSYGTLWFWITLQPEPKWLK